MEQVADNSNCNHCGAQLSPPQTAPTCHRCILQTVLQTEEQEIRDEALKLGSSEERAAFIQGAAADNPALCDRLLAWLTSAESNPNGIFLAGSNLDNLDSLEISGRYRLIQKIGEGGFGTVYLAEQTEPVKRRVALKIIKLGMDTRQVVVRFEAERQALAMMDHPNIARVFDAGATQTGRPYFVMELVRGIPLTAYCNQHQLSIRQRLEIFLLLCQAIQHAHQKGIIHRDLKPSNILVAEEGGRAAPKIIDFGIAKATQSRLTENTAFTALNQFAGTPAYLSPEQAEMSADIDTRGDIYSLGVLLYELLTGITPFDPRELLASGLDEMRRIIREKIPPRPSQTKRPAAALNADPNLDISIPFGGKNVFSSRSQIDPDLDCIVMKCLEKDRTCRYATANGLGMDIQRFLDDEPVAARPPSTFYRASKLVRRYPVTVGLGALVFLLLTGSLIAGLSLNLRLARANQESVLANNRLSQTVRYLESDRMEELAAQGRKKKMLIWLAGYMRQNPSDPVAASRAISMLSLHNFALPAAPPLVCQGTVNTAEISPDGTRILTASDDGTVRVWNAASSQLLVAITNAFPVDFARYGARGGRIFTKTRDGKVRLYDSANLGLLLEIPGVSGQAAQAFDSPNGSWLYTIHEDNSVSRWDFQRARKIEPTFRATERIEFTAISEPANRLAISASNRVHLLNASTGEQVAVIDSPAHFMGFVPDGRRLFIIPGDGKRVIVWDLERSERKEFLPPDASYVEAMVFSPDSRYCVSWAWKQPPRVWDSYSFHLLRELKGADTQGLANYAISSDSKLLVGASQTGTARVWELQSGRSLIEPFEHQGFIRTIRFDGNSRVLTGSIDASAQLWDVRMRLPSIPPPPQRLRGSEARFNHAGNQALVSAQGNALQVWDADTGRPVSPLLFHPGDPDKSAFWCAEFSPDDSKILAAGMGSIRVWDARSFQLSLDLSVPEAPRTTHFSSDGHYIISMYGRGQAWIWNAETGAYIGATLENAGDLTTVEVHPSRPEFVLTHANGDARCWTLPDIAAGPVLRHRGIVWSGTYSPDGNRVVTACGDGAARIWNPLTGESLLKPMRHEKDVFSARFSPNGKWILTTSDDGTARVWDASTAEPVSPFLRHAANIWMGAFSPDSRWVATGSSDQTVRIWDSLSGLPLSDPLWHQTALGRLSFKPDGQRLLTNGGQPLLWDVLIAPAPVPSWFCDLVDAVAGARLAPDGQVQTVESARAISALTKQVSIPNASDFYTRWTKWFLEDRMQDPAPPFVP
jgi:WD40 repeat protein/tRNA A-37 threonylcarbamoyl transferase component Bud32